MRLIFFAFILLMIPALLHAQDNPNNTKVTPIDTVKPNKGPAKEQIKEIDKAKVKQLSDSTGGNEPRKNALIDTTVKNKYGDLLDDDSAYNKKYIWWKPAVGVLSVNAFVFTMDRFL